MDSSWFPKPVFKKVRWIAIFFIAGSVAYAYSHPAGWLYTSAIGLLWLTFSLICSFNVRSGAYIKTINSGVAGVDQIYLTFDDGPVSSTYNILKILDKLEDYHPDRPREANEYHRQHIEAFNVAGEELGLVWVYLMKPQQIKLRGGECLPDGVWSCRY